MTDVELKEKEKKSPGKLEPSLLIDFTETYPRFMFSFFLFLFLLSLCAGKKKNKGSLKVSSGKRTHMW